MNALTVRSAFSGLSGSSTSPNGFRPWIPLSFSMDERKSSAIRSTRRAVISIDSASYTGMFLTLPLATTTHSSQSRVFTTR